MNLNALATAGLFAVLGLGAFTAHADSNVPVENYHYGVHLDVHKVLSSHEDDSSTCGVTTAQMNYLDAHGQEHRLQYPRYASACHEGG